MDDRPLLVQGDRVIHRPTGRIGSVIAVTPGCDGGRPIVVLMPDRLAWERGGAAVINARVEEVELTTNINQREAM